MRKLFGKKSLIDAAQNKANACVQRGDYLGAELAFEELVLVVRSELDRTPTDQLKLSLAYALMGLADSIKKTGAKSEQEPFLQEAFSVAKTFMLGQEALKAEILFRLGDMYRLEQSLILWYDGSYRPNLEEQREYRRQRAAERKRIVARTAPGWHENGLKPLTIAASLYDSLGDSIMKAHSLNMLGEVYLKVGDPQAARSVLRDAEAIYRELEDSHPGEFTKMLENTLELLEIVPYSLAARLAPQLIPISKPL